MARRAALIACAAAAGILHAGDPPRFAPEEIVGWEHHSFTGRTRYELVELPEGSAVHAVCSGSSASGLFLRREIDLTETPVIEWHWRVDETLSGNKERTMGGDDYPARIYVVDEHPVLQWRTRALNYVWASGEPAGSDWPNAFLPQTRMVAVRSGPPAAKEAWSVERRNIRRDFRRYHHRDPARVNTLAVMTDCDNTGQPAEAWYGVIRFLPG